MIKKVHVQMSSECHSLLKDYANAFDMTMSEVGYEAIRSYMHKHSRDCNYIQTLFRFKQITQDKRISKACYGHPCFVCLHETACRIGKHEGMWEMDPAREPYGSQGIELRP
jgi:hypothetical protein